MKRTIFSALILSVVSAVAMAGDTSNFFKAVQGKSLKAARGIDIEANLRNDAANFGVRVTVDHKDRIYAKGELVYVTVVSGKPGYLYLLYKQADGSTKCLFPNLYESNNKIEARTPITLPTANQGFNLRCNKPFGKELLYAIVSEKPLAVEQLGVKSLTKNVMTDINLEKLGRDIQKGIEVVGNSSAINPNEVAEHSVSITTVEKRDDIDATKPQHQRIGLFIGISKYKDHHIRALKVSHLDAAVMGLVMKEQGNLNGVATLINENATRSNIEKAFRELKLRTNPGDEIIIYWSGHGGTMADTDGDEQGDKFDEFLVPYDADTGKIVETVISDDTLGRWVQELDGRKVTIIFDACHAGGAAENKGMNNTKSKSLSEGDNVGELLKRVQKDNTDSSEPSFKSFTNSRFQIGGTRPRKDGHDFMWDVHERLQALGTKDIRAQDAAMLLSCKSDEISAERRDGKLSVMTYFLVKKLAEDNSLTLKQAYDHVKVEVPKYMKEHYSNRKQNPQLCPEDGAGVKLK